MVKGLSMGKEYAAEDGSMVVFEAEILHCNKVEGRLFVWLENKELWEITHDHPEYLTKKLIAKDMITRFRNKRVFMYPNLGMI
jgi:hypothetical protein